MSVVFLLVVGMMKKKMFRRKRPILAGIPLYADSTPFQCFLVKWWEGYKIGHKAVTPHLNGHFFNSISFLFPIFLADYEFELSVFELTDLPPVKKEIIDRDNKRFRFFVSFLRKEEVECFSQLCAVIQLESQ